MFLGCGRLRLSWGYVDSGVKGLGLSYRVLNSVVYAGKGSGLQKQHEMINNKQKRCLVVKDFQGIVLSLWAYGGICYKLWTALMLAGF